MSFGVNKSTVEAVSERENVDDAQDYGESRYGEGDAMSAAIGSRPQQPGAFEESYEPTPEEEQGLCRAFALLDVNGEGVLEARVLESLLKALGRLPFDDEIRTVLSFANEAGREDSVGMSFHGFKEYVGRQLQNTWDEAELRESFRVFDSEPPTGNVDLRELRFYLKNKGMKLTDEEIDFLFKEEDFWMLEDSHDFSYQELIDKILDKAECRSKFLGC